jgi:hypothetical protein
VSTDIRARLTEDDVRDLPVVVNVPTAAAVLGIGRSAAYELIRCDRWPTPTLRPGKSIRIPTGPLLELVRVQR